jgi:hypothetical protein
VKLLEANPAIRYNLFSKRLFLQKEKRASFGRFFSLTKNSHFPKKGFPLLSGLKTANPIIFQRKITINL